MVMLVRNDPSLIRKTICSDLTISCNSTWNCSPGLVLSSYEAFTTFRLSYFSAHSALSEGMWRYLFSYQAFFVNREFSNCGADWTLRYFLHRQNPVYKFLKQRKHIKKLKMKTISFVIYVYLETFKTYIHLSEKIYSHRIKVQISMLIKSLFF